MSPLLLFTFPSNSLPGQLSPFFWLEGFAIFLQSQVSLYSHAGASSAFGVIGFSFVYASTFGTKQKLHWRTATPLAQVSFEATRADRRNASSPR